MIYLLLIVLAIGSWWLPWWWLILPTAWSGTRAKTGQRAFALGFLSVFILWLVVSYYFDLKSQGQTSLRLAGIFALPAPVLSYVLTGLVGGLIGGLSSLSGFYLQNIKRNA